MSIHFLFLEYSCYKKIWQIHQVQCIDKIIEVNWNRKLFNIFFKWYIFNDYLFNWKNNILEVDYKNTFKEERN